MNSLSRVALCLLALGTALSAFAAQTLRLTNGTALVGQITKEENGKIYFKADLLGDLVIEAVNVASRSDAPPAVGPTPPVGVPSSAPAGPVILGAAGKPAADPNKPVWTRKITAGANYTSATFVQGPVKVGVPLPAGTPVPTGASLGLSGRQLGKQFSASLTRVTPQNTFSFEGKYTYFDIQPFGRQVDNYSATVSYLQHINATYYAVSRTSCYEDKVRNIDYSAVQIVGIGRMLINQPMTKLELVPGVVLLKERRHLPTDGDVQTGAGFLENFSHAFNPFVKLEQRVLYRTIFQHSELTAVDGYLGLKGKLTPKLGFTTGVTYTYDRSLGRALLPKTPLPIYANEETQVSITSGFEYNF
jgi:hypothetical protein